MKLYYIINKEKVQNTIKLFTNVGKGYVFAKKNKHEIKKSKKKVTILFTCSMLGKKLKPLVIGKFLKPRCFSNIKNLPLEYTANKKSWMTRKIFTNYLNKWNIKLKLSNRKILLFLDNFSTHLNLNLSNITFVISHQIQQVFYNHLIKELLNVLKQYTKNI